MKKNKKIYELHSLEFLNAGIDEVYYRKKHFASGKDTMFLKSMVASIILRFERMCRYAYFSDLNIPEAYHNRLFKEQFPFLYEKFHDNEYWLLHNGERCSLKGIKYFTVFLERLRNINLHAVISTPLASTMQVDPLFIKEFPKISENVDYVKNGILTVAGMLIIMYSTMRSNPEGGKSKSDIDNDLKKSINYFTNVWGDTVWGEEQKYSKSRDLYELLRKVFRTNYEVEIRKPVETEDVMEAIFGEFYNDSLMSIERDNGYLHFSLNISERENAPYFGVSGHIKSFEEIYMLTIHKGSNIGKYFSEDYELKIDDKVKFIEYCGLTPPFMCISYMYQNGIRTLSQISEDDVEKLKKLNKPKFYRDKDLTILCSGMRNADMREINKSLTEGLMRFFLKFENDGIFRKNILVTDYSRLANVLNELGIQGELKSKMVTIRNFCAHYGILNNFQNYSKEKGYYIDISFIGQTIYELFEKLDNFGCVELVALARKIFHENVINNLIGVKYKRLFEMSLDIFSAPAERIVQKISDFNRSWKVVENSVINSDAENILMQSGLPFSFILKKAVMSDGSNKYNFFQLSLVAIECEGLMIRGVEIPNAELKFFIFGSKIPEVLSVKNKNVSLRLVSEEKIGILNKLTYKAVEE